MAVRYLLAIVVALVSLDELHGALGRSLLVSHGERGIAVGNALRPALMEASSRARARQDETHYWAGYSTVEGEYYGAVARINVWGLKLKPGQTSVSAMWISSDGGINQIMAGFQISPDTYNDTDPHFFVSWTADGFNTTGCLDTYCHGFVRSRHAAPSISPGAPVSRPSVYHGRQTDFTITILKDRGASATRGWWLYVDVRGKQEPVGHFPASLFAGLGNHATAVGWGGAVRSAAAGTVPLPPMGSGHGPAEEAGGSAYIADIGVFHSSTGKAGNPRAPAAADLTPLRADPRGCYRAGEFQIAQHDGSAFFYYGGPSGCDQ